MADMYIEIRFPAMVMYRAGQSTEGRCVLQSLRIKLWQRNMAAEENVSSVKQRSVIRCG